MTELVRRFDPTTPVPYQSTSEGVAAASLQQRALRQAARELLLAQSSDWPFILKTGTSPEYARHRVTEHLSRFSRLYEQLLEGRVDRAWLARLELQDDIFPELDYRYFG